MTDGYLMMPVNIGDGTPDGIAAGVGKCRKSLDDAAEKFGLK